MNGKTKRFFSGTLMKQNIKSNYVLGIAIILVMCLMSVVNTYANGIMTKQKMSEDAKAAQGEFFQYLYVMASYNDQMKATQNASNVGQASDTYTIDDGEKAVAQSNEIQELSYDNYVNTSDKAVYEQVFTMASQQSEGMELTIEKFDNAIKSLEEESNEGVKIENYVHEFEYVYALGNVKGCFSDSDLSMEDMMSTMLQTMGIEPDMLQKMEEMDTTALFNRMYFTSMGLLPILLFIIIVANALIVDQVDKGSMAYVLSTPTKRRAVTNTQTIFLVVCPLIILSVVCAANIISSFIFTDDVIVSQKIMLYLGMYILTEAVAGICYFGSCFFNRSKNAMAFGGGISIWFFLASMLGMFGSKDMVNMGFGSENLAIFDKTTLVGLFDVNSLSTIGTGDVNYDFVWKLCILAVVAIVGYVLGGQIFKKKDLPL